MSAKEFGCFFCEGKSADSDGTCIKCGSGINIADELMNQTIAGYSVAEIIGRGFYGWTTRVQDNVPQSFAMKLIPKHRITNTNSVFREAQSLVACSNPPHPHIVRFFRVIESELTLNNKKVEVICLLFDFIPDAIPLRKLIEEATDPLTRGDIVGILSGIAWGLARMHGKNLWHNDLHDDNVIIRIIPRDEGVTHRFESKLIDFGSARPSKLDQPEIEGRGDYYYLGKHIYGLVGAFERCQEKLTQADRTLAASLRRLAHQIMDPNISRREKDPEAIAADIESVLADCSTGHERPSFESMLETIRVSITNPLDNTNALSLKPQDITLLFTDKLKWESQISKAETVIIVGPRGCGKTMLLRYLSIPSQAWPRKAETKASHVASRLRKTPFLGFLVSCTDLRTPFLRSGYKMLESSLPERAEDFCREYINAHFGAEVARSILWLKSEGMADIDDAELRPLAACLAKLLTIEEPTPAQTSGDLGTVLERLEGRIVQLSSPRDPKSYRPSEFCRDDVLSTVARAIASIPWCRNKEVRFLLDDYSVTVLPPFVQQAYNPVLFRLSGDARLKVSSEGDGPDLSDSLERKYKEGRELTKVNLGEIYFRVNEKRARDFVESILDARCRETGAGSIDQLKHLLGDHPHEESFGSYICKMHAKSAAGRAKFYGFGLLCRLCSGDVSYIIELLRSVVGDNWSGDTSPIDADIQDTIVKRFARRQLTDLKRTSQYGPKLHDFAMGVGALLRNYLTKSFEKKQKGNKNRIDERLRIEIEGGGILSAEAQIIHNELLRHSVLVDGGYGKSRSGEPTRMLFVRRLFAPCFPFSPSRRGCIALSQKQYEQWLLNPASIYQGNDTGDDSWSGGLGGLGGSDGIQ